MGVGKVVILEEIVQKAMINKTIPMLGATIAKILDIQQDNAKKKDNKRAIRELDVIDAKITDILQKIAMSKEMRVT